MITKYLLIFGIGHLLGEFYFQDEKMAKYREQEYKGIFIHSLEYYIVILLTILPIFSTDMVVAATYISFIHFFIDTVKYVLLKKKKIRKYQKVFVIDQCAHISSILLFTYILDRQNIPIGLIGIVNDILNRYGLEAKTLAKWILAILFIHTPANLFIQNFIEDHKPKSDDAVIQVDNRAGRRIGTVERLIMLMFLAVDQYVAIGFVFTAKSIARYDKITKDEKFAEYYLLGTLLSALCAIICNEFLSI